MPMNGKNNKGQTAVHVASKAGALGSLQIMLAVKKRSEGMKMLIATDTDGKDALWHGCEHNHRAVVDFVLKSGVDPSKSSCPVPLLQKHMPEVGL
jgi:ankyrin repeat protein